MKKLATDRKFCRFNKAESTATGRADKSGLTTREIPEGGLCLSSFLVLREKDHGEKVLMGHLDPRAPWDHIGALDESRISIHSKGWMLPSCHLMICESPAEAASRVAKEQLALEELDLSEPVVVSEVSKPKRFPNLSSHWDIEFIFYGSLSADRLKGQHAWLDLEFLNPVTTAKSSIARSHEDILESAGFRVGAIGKLVGPMD